MYVSLMHQSYLQFLFDRAGTTAWLGMSNKLGAGKAPDRSSNLLPALSFLQSPRLTR